MTVVYLKRKSNVFNKLNQPFLLKGGNLDSPESVMLHSVSKLLGCSVKDGQAAIVATTEDVSETQL